MKELELALTLSESSIQTWMNAASGPMTNCCATTSVTTTSVVSTAPVVMATCYTLTTGPAEVRLPGYWSITAGQLIDVIIYINIIY